MNIHICFTKLRINTVYLSIFGFIYFCGFKPALIAQVTSEEEVEILQQLDTLLEGTLPDTTKLAILNNQVRQLNYLNSETPFRLVEKGIAYAEKMGDPYWIGIYYGTLGLFYCNTLRIDTSIVLFKQSLEYLEQADDLSEQAYAHGILRYLYAVEEEFEQSLKHCYAAMAIYESQNDLEGIGATYNDIAGTLISAEKYEEALAIALKGREILERQDNLFELLSITEKIANCHEELGDWEQGLSIRSEIIEIIEEDPDNLPPVLTLNFYHDLTWTLVQLEKYDLALQNISRIRKILEKTPMEGNYIATLIDESDIMFAIGEYEKSIELLYRAWEADKKADRTLNLVDIFNDLSEGYAALEQYDSAYHYQLKYQDVSTEKRAHETALKMDELRTEYETEQKEATIATQEKMIKQQRTIQWVVVSISVLVGILFMQSFLNARTRKRINAALQESNDALEVKNQENELLLKEIHHRVKNNLQTISSLLSLQSESISDPKAWDAVQESKNRVASMALLHQKLYQGENLAAIEMRDYFNTIGKAVIDSFGEKGRNVQLLVDMSELELDVDTAVPVGLITNELITNSLKYAFPDDHKGQISISLLKGPDGLFQLQIADDGRPDAKENTSDKSGGFGTLLVQLLTAQLGGKLETHRDNGTSTILEFGIQQKSAA